MTSSLWEPNSDRRAPAAPEEARWRRLMATFGLDDFEGNVLLVALAPEIDLRYERIYAYLQDDVSRKRPTVHLALDLLSNSPKQRLQRLARFSADAPLRRHRLVQLVPDQHQSEPPLLANYLRLDEQTHRFLLGLGGLDSRIAVFCSVSGPGAPNTQLARGLAGIVGARDRLPRPLALHFKGPRGAGQRESAEALAAAWGCQLLRVDLERAVAADLDFGLAVSIVTREAWMSGALLYFDGLDMLLQHEPRSRYQTLLQALAAHDGIAILAGSHPWLPSAEEPLGVMTVDFPVPAAGQRRDLWERTLREAGIDLHALDLAALAGRFRLTGAQIANALASASAEALATAGGSEHAAGPSARDLFRAARAQTGQELAALTHKIEPRYAWSDIVVPEDTRAQLREICQRVAHSPQVLDAWGFGSKLSLGKGVTALFSGPTGTGKTMAAEVIASDLGLDLYRIDLSSVVSKYIGETEKNLDRIFQAAEDTNGIVFFDEADALFGKRSEVRDSHDRYANVEIAYLLQKMEEYEGIAILATNLRGNLDEAFTRRLSFTVHFPFPDEEHRRDIWAGIWPAGAPVADDVDLAFLAREFKLSGGNIKNVALASAFLAAEAGGQITMAQVLRAVRREFQKLGRGLREDELRAPAAGDGLAVVGAAK